MEIIKSIVSLEKFTTVIKKKCYPFDYWFRGQSNQRWGLVPRIGRKKYLIRYDKFFPRQFKRLSMPFLDKSLMPSNNFEWTMLAQHHGLPTNLLDWTSNPLVALYFAINENFSKDGVVWVISSDMLPELTDENLSKKQAEAFAFHPSHISSRITTQSSFFTYHSNPLLDISKHKQMQKLFKKIIIKKENKSDIIMQLNRLGINQFSLFPGLDGLCEYLRWYAKNY